VTVIYNAASPRFHEKVPTEQIAMVRKKYRLPEQYFLFLGGFDKRKNVGTLVEAFAQLPEEAPPLVLAGEHKWEFAAISKRIAALGLSERVLCPDAIADEDLPALYQGAIALVHPSRYEGFGLQLVEAMASGIPVLASRTTSLPEVLGGCGLLFDPEGPASIALQMERIARDGSLRTALIESGRERARFFSWRKAAKQTLGLYFDLLGRGDEITRLCGLQGKEHQR
jgi:alpha-1,3-rhamnosyl/mannosyltransferase